MSPYEPLTLSHKPTTTTTPSPSLEDYTVSSNGFLPEHPPLERLLDPYYAPWETLAESLPTALAEQTLRASVDRLPILLTDRLPTESEWRRACLVLGFLAHAYIWGGDKPSETLPPQLTRPLLAVSSRLGLPPVATYASLNLWNFRTTPGGSLTDPDSLHALLTFTGTRSESWFYTLSVALEARAAHLPGMIVSALSVLPSPLSLPRPLENSRSTTTAPELEELLTHLTPEPPLNTLNDLSDADLTQPNPQNPPTTNPNHTTMQTLSETLTEISHTLAALTALQDRMHDHCDPHVFYHRIRPFLAGSWNMGAAGLERGVFYDEGVVEDGDEGDREGRDDGGGGLCGGREVRGGGEGGKGGGIKRVGAGESEGGCDAGGNQSDERNGTKEGNNSDAPAKRKGQWRRLRGGSNGQSALIGLLDWALGVEHAPGTAGEGDYHREVREYMPEGHRRFLADLEGAYPGGLRKVVGELVMASDSSPALVPLKEAFDTAVAALGAFRNRHLQMVTRYIIIPSRQPGGVQGQGVNLATATSARAGGSGAREELTGTGGTALLPFLKQSRDETFRAWRLQGVRAG